ncbi:M4 family metallopeptidase [Corallococcus sicarius]|nr:M4 family metallopeptidase [Corallococcus sicarius]
MRTLKRFPRLALAGLLAFQTSCQGLDEDVVISNLQVVSTDPAHVPTFANGNFGQLRLGAEKRTEEAEVRALRPTLAALEKVFRVDPTELSFKQVVADNIGDRHFVYEQRKNGIEVVGGVLVLHTRSDVVYAVHGNARADLPAPRDARLSADDAITLAKKDSAHVVQLRVEELPRRAYWPSGDTLDLVYRVNVMGLSQEGGPVDDEVIVNAMSGAIVQRISNIHTLKNREVHDALHATSAAGLPGPTIRAEGGPLSSDAVVNTNYNMLGTVYDCYQSVFGRDSYDNAGAPLVSSVHYGNNYANAGWLNSKKQMIYGDGDGVTFGPMTDALDVTAHEITHGLTAATSTLMYYGEPGALNESMSDIMGSVCEWYRNGRVVTANTWKCAEDIYTPGTPGDALRYMNDPKADGQSIDYFDSTFSQFTDVHLSSGIPNLAFHLLSVGGRHPRNRSTITVPGIGIAKAAQIFHRANTVMLLGKYFTHFAEAKIATEQAAAQLGYSASDIAAVTAAWQAVGVGTNQLVANQGLTLGQGVSSIDGRFTLVLQGDGNLVHYRNGYSSLWTANTWGMGAKSAFMQSDGNFAVYSTTVPTAGYAVWSSNTYGHPGAFLTVQDDGNVVIYDKDGVTALWHTGTYGY